MVPGLNHYGARVILSKLTLKEFVRTDQDKLLLEFPWLTSEVISRLAIFGGNIAKQ